MKYSIGNLFPGGARGPFGTTLCLILQHRQPHASSSFSVLSLIWSSSKPGIIAPGTGDIVKGPSFCCSGLLPAKIVGGLFFWSVIVAYPEMLKLERRLELGDEEFEENLMDTPRYFFLLLPLSCPLSSFSSLKYSFSIAAHPPGVKDLFCYWTINAESVFTWLNPPYCLLGSPF